MITGFLQKRCIYLLIIILLLVFQGCRVKQLPGILLNHWYICDELQIAVRFESPAEGVYVSTNRALASPRRFTFRKSGDNSVLNLSGHQTIKGKMSVFYDTFYLESQHGKIKFSQYVTHAFPRPPYRYKEAVFGRVSVDEIQYGQASGYYASKPMNVEQTRYGQIVLSVAQEMASNLRRRDIPLHMDVYEPEGDRHTLRPLLVLLHGGAFILGDKRDELVSTLARDFANKGFVVVSVNYRLGYVFLPGQYANSERAMYNALQDARAAVRFMAHHKERFRIDPDFVFIGGNSAGAITALYTTFMDDSEVWPSVKGTIFRTRSDLGCIDCSTNELFAPFTIRGVINMWGAVDNLDIIKRQDNIPILSIHGDNDRIVPYNHQFPFTNVSPVASAFFSRRLFGSASILEHTSNNGLNHTLHTFHGYGHEPQSDMEGLMIPENYQLIQNLILDFVNTQVFPPLNPINGPRRVSYNEPVATYWTEQGYYKNHLFACDDCLILEQTPNSVRIVWLDGKSMGQLQYAGIGPYGQTQSDTLSIMRNPSFVGELIAPE